MLVRGKGRRARADAADLTRKGIPASSVPPPEGSLFVSSEDDASAVTVGVHDLLRTEIVRGVNICPPVDYKPEHSDRYCVRCEGFAECTARNMRLNRPKRIDADPRAKPVPET